MKYSFFLIVIMPINLWAQGHTLSTDTTAEIHFQHGLNWSQILAKAKSEHKSIFVDCYATWCGPCKKMDREVYTDPSVGQYCNTHFISVKFQMDSARGDDATTMSSYADAAYIRSHYNISVYPTLLFFTADGQILSQNLGSLEPQAFLQFLSDVLDPRKNYYDLLTKYRQGRRDLKEMHFLAQTALQLVNDTVTAGELAKAYLATLKPDSVFTKDNIEFMREFTRNTKDKGFVLFYNHSSRINSLMNDDDYSQSIVQRILYNEIVKPALMDVKRPVQVTEAYWNQLEQKIGDKYNAYYSKRVIAGAKMVWARAQQWRAEYTKLFSRYIHTYIFPLKNSGHWFAFALNNDAWEIFLRSNSNSELIEALSWSKKAVLMDPAPGWMDTYANLLYKTGQAELAIGWEKIANLANPADKVIADNLQKMKKGEPTWPTP